MRYLAILLFAACGSPSETTVEAPKPPTAWASRVAQSVPQDAAVVVFSPNIDNMQLGKFLDLLTPIPWTGENRRAMLNDYSAMIRNEIGVDIMKAESVAAFAISTGGDDFVGGIVLAPIPGRAITKTPDNCSITNSVMICSWEGEVGKLGRPELVAASKNAAIYTHIDVTKIDGGSVARNFGVKKAELWMSSDKLSGTVQGREETLQLAKGMIDQALGEIQNDVKEEEGVGIFGYYAVQNIRDQLKISISGDSMNIWLPLNDKISGAVPFMFAAGAGAFLTLDQKADEPTSGAEDEVEAISSNVAKPMPPMTRTAAPPPDPDSIATVVTIDNLQAAWVKRSGKRKGQCPKSVKAMAAKAKTKSRPQVVDGWGTKIKMTCTKGTVTLMSAGADKTFGTRDDFAKAF